MAQFDLSGWLNSINITKTNLIEESADKQSKEDEYNPYIVNRLMSLHPDTILYVNELNYYNFLPKRMQYEFLLYGIRPKKRWAKWIKPDKSEDVELIKKYFGYSKKKAEEALEILSPEQIEEIKQRLFEGGLSKNKK